MKRLYFILAFLCLLNVTFSQTAPGGNYISWTSIRKLKPDDFIIKKGDLKTGSSFAQFVMDYQVNGFDFMRKNFNKKVHNYIIKSASWLDTTSNVAQSIRYQQTLWDICEIYTRRFRKELKDNRRKIASGTEFIKEMNARIMSDFSIRRMEYTTEAKFGSDSAAQKKWDIQIQKELDELVDFSLE